MLSAMGSVPLRWLTPSPAGNDTALQPSLVITGLVPVIPMVSSAVLFRIGMAGTSPAMT